MRKETLSLLFALSLMLAGPVSAAGWTGNINGFLGGKGLDEDDWLADSHGEAGVLLDFGGADWPVLIAVDMLSSRGDFDGYVYSSSRGIHYYEEDVETREVNLGVRKYWDVGTNMHPYVGGGLALVHLEAEGRAEGEAAVTDSGNGEGIWVGGGIQWRFGQFNLGFSVRVSSAEVSLDTGDYQGGGGHTGLLLGYHW